MFGTTRILRSLRIAWKEPGFLPRRPGLPSLWALAAEALTLALCLLASCSAQQLAPLRYALAFHNAYASVLRLDLPPRRDAPIHDNQDDVLWIALDDQMLAIEHADSRTDQTWLRAADVRLFSRRDLHAISNAGHAPLHSVVIHIEGLRVPFAACSCSRLVTPQYRVCGCSSARLPLYWAEVIGDITISGGTLQPGQSLSESGARDDTLLVSVTPSYFQHDLGDNWNWAPAAPRGVALMPGGVLWMPEGKHRLSNIGERRATFVSIEFTHSVAAQQP